MPRYIDAIAEQREIEIVGHERFLTSGDVDEVKLFLEEQPTADVAPVVHAHWVKNRDRKEATCSVCTLPITDDIGDIEKICRYCPSCGSKMDEEVVEI